MKVTLIELPKHPGRIAVTKVGAVVPGGAFFLDFTRPIEILRWLGISNRWFGFAAGLLVPVIHQNEESGALVISVTPTDPYFGDLRKLWKARYPAKAVAPTTSADGLTIVAHFATQFPDDCRPAAS